MVTLDVKAINGDSLCASSPAADIAADPVGYVNSHTPAAPGGALRGQLASARPSGVNAGSGGQAGTTEGTSVSFSSRWWSLVPGWPGLRVGVWFGADSARRHA